METLRRRRKSTCNVNVPTTNGDAGNAAGMRRKSTLRKEITAKEKMNLFMQTRYMIGVYLFASMFALFGDDFNVCCMPKSTDTAIAIVFLVVFILFLIELLALSWCKPKYLWSFFFYLDLVALLSLIPNLPWIAKYLYMMFGGDDDDSTTSDFTLARAGRAARTGTRIGRMLRLVRLARWFRLMPRIMALQTYFFGKSSDAYLQQMSERENEGHEVDYEMVQDELDEDEDDPYDLEEEAVLLYSSVETTRKIGKKVSDRISRKVIIGVLLILIVMPLLEQAPMSPIAPLENHLAALGRSYNTSSYETELQAYISDYHNIVYLQVYDSVEIDQEGRLDDLRSYEIFPILTENCEVQFDEKGYVQWDAIYSIFTVFFMLFLLGFGSVIFTRDSTRMFLEPIGRLAKLLVVISENPGAEIMRREEDEATHTSFLEVSLMRVADLLRGSFGGLSKDLIRINAAGRIELRKEGRRIDAILMSIHIRHTLSATWELREEVIVLLNEISYIVHRHARRHGAVVHATTGDSLALFWVISDEHFDCSAIAESALLTALGIIDDVRALSLSSRTEWMCRRLSNFHVSVGVGLHTGWIIVGAVGTDVKVDTTVVSPSTAFVQDLARASVLYGVHVLLSEDYHFNMLPRTQRLCRFVDSIYSSGVTNKILTYDHGSMANQESVVSSLDAFTQLALPLPSTSEEYRHSFEKIVDAFSSGKWKNARELLLECQKKLPQDRVIKLLLAVIQDRDEAPESWTGYRTLLLPARL